MIDSNSMLLFKLGEPTLAITVQYFPNPSRMIDSNSLLLFNLGELTLAITNSLFLL